MIFNWLNDHCDVCWGEVYDWMSMPNYVTWYEIETYCRVDGLLADFNHFLFNELDNYFGDMDEDSTTGLAQTKAQCSRGGDDEEGECHKKPCHCLGHMVHEFLE